MKSIEKVEHMDSRHRYSPAGELCVSLSEGAVIDTFGAAREALDGRRAARRHALKEIRKAIAAALDDMQRAAYHGRRAQSESPGLWSRRE